jgi:hypothetical protein
VSSVSPDSRTMGISFLRYGTPLLFFLNDIKHFCWNWSVASFSYCSCSGERSSMVPECHRFQASWSSTEGSHWACQKVCWRKICTLRQAHSKPNKLASHANKFQDVPVNFPWKLTKDKVVKFQSLELAGWYQTVPYLRLESHVRWHIATGSYLPAN